MTRPRRRPTTRAADPSLGALQRLLKGAVVDGASLALTSARQHTVRFAFGRVHQDLFQHTSTLYAKVARGGRVGVAVAHSADPVRWRDCLRRAGAIADVSPKVSGGATFPAPQPVPRVNGHAPATAAATPAAYLERLQHLLRLAQGCDVQLAGSLVVADEMFTVVNSSGIRLQHPSTVASLRLVAVGPTCSGYATHTVHDIASLDWEGCLERALKKCVTRKTPRDLPAGRYTVLLEPEAVAELLTWLGYLGFGAKQFAEHTSFFCGRMGDQITGKHITIVDDGTDPATLATPFDFEGMPKQRVPLIEHGIATGLVYDTHYARLYDTHSTGHAGSPDGTEGPLPGHLALAAGEATRESLLRAVDRGLLITRFHYVNGFLDPRNTLMTGLTRDGTWLVENGKLIAPVRNLRFTERVLEAFGRTQLIGRDRHLVADPAQDGGGFLCPSLLVKDWTFTGRSDEP